MSKLHTRINDRRSADVTAAPSIFNERSSTLAVGNETSGREQQVLNKLLETYVQDRKLIACEIHDGVVQCLSGAVMNLEASLQMLGEQVPAAAQKGFDETLQLLRDGITEARWLINGMQPAMLDEIGLVDAITHLVRKNQNNTQTSVEWSHRGNFDRLAPPLETTIFRIIQEGLTNALRHSDSNRVCILLYREGQRILINVQDWGRGFDPQKITQDRFGIQGIRRRAKAFGGQAAIDSAPGQGTRIVVEIPLVERCELECLFVE